jgi:AraC-like DNA-binding protein
LEKFWRTFSKASQRPGAPILQLETGRLPPFLHHSWLGFTLTLAPRDPPRVFHARSVSHLLTAVEDGSRFMRWIQRGEERRWTEDRGTVQIVPCDGDAHTFVTTSDRGCTLSMLLIPFPHLDELFAAASAAIHRDGRAPVVLHDDLLWRCVVRLTTPQGSSGPGFDGPPDEAARTLVARLRRLAAAPDPRWHDGPSVFQPHTVERLVDRIDGSLTHPPSVGELAILVGLSASHCATKFRHSTGFSPQRFINRRRIQASLRALQDESPTTADVAASVGFCSQSHFTRLFSGLTGLTPARFKSQFRSQTG